MRFLFKKKKENEIVAIFDIGSGSIGGAIVRIPFDDNKTPIILKTIRTEINYTSKKIETSAFTKGMLKALDLTANDLHHTTFGAPNKIVCVLATPWYSLETKTIKINKESSFVFNKKVAEDLIQKEIKNTKIDHKKKSKTLYSELEIIENHIMNVSLNGYKVESPLGMKTKSVEMNTITASSTKFLLDKIRKIISKTFHETPLSFSSFILAFYFTVRDRYVSPDSYLLLDIGGEITEVGIVVKGILKATLSFPFGKKTFFKYISTKLEIDLRDAKELFKLYSSGDLSAIKRKKVAPLFKSAEASWSESFRQCIGSLPYILALPSTIFLTADSDLIDYFSEVICNEEFIQSMTIEHKCTVVPFKGKELLEICKIKEEIDCDPFLIIGAISVMKKR